MFTNSLFKDFMMENGMKSRDGDSTKDIICLEFNYGTRSFDEEIKHIKKIAVSARITYKVAKASGSSQQLEKQENKKRKIQELWKFANEHKNEYEKLSKEEIRRRFYNDGVSVEYTVYKKTGDRSVKSRETIHYQMLYRSTGKAKKGSCMFIRDRLFKKARNFLYMGITPPKKNAPIVELSAYAPLISSAIVGRIKIDPRNILILEDIAVPFNTKVISIETDENKECHAVPYDHYELKNELFDGQALIDESVFPDWGRGYVLLRQHFCKMAAFCTNLQQFYRDYFGEEYEAATVRDMWGNEHFVKDIQLVTTNNAVKWLKFNKSYEYWCEWVDKNGDLFGVVKTAHPSKLGKVQKMSYQMVNSLDESIMPDVCKESLAYIERLKTDDDFFLGYLEKNQNFSNDFEVLIALCKHNKDFVRSSYFRERKRKIIMNYVVNFKSGKIIQNADNLVIVGSPYAMLLYSATGDKSIIAKDSTFSHEDGTIQCYTRRFAHGEYLAEFRSPHNGKNNIGYIHNIYSPEMEKYFNFCPEILAVNLIGTDWQSRNNGADQDSDSCYTTNQPQIVAWAKHCYENYPTIENNIPKDTNKYDCTMDDYALIDNKLAASQLDIGESSNLAQIAQTYDCSFGNQLYKDAVCILSVLAQIAIDSAKRQFDLDVGKEIRRLKKEIGVNENGYPGFWLIIRPGFNKSLIADNLRCPMNYLYNLNLDQFRTSSPTLPMSSFFVPHTLDRSRKTCRKVENLITKYAQVLNIHNQKVQREDDDRNSYSIDENYMLLHVDFENLIEDIRRIYVSGIYVGLFSWLLNRALTITTSVANNNRKLKSQIKRNRSILFKTLYMVNKSAFLQCFTTETAV